MKKYLFLSLLAVLAITSNLSAQSVNNKFVYCEIVGTGKMLSNKVTVSVDFGQATKFFSDTRLKNADGKAVVFNSMVDAMNWMGNDGWEFAQAYVVTVGNNQNVYHWLLKKDISMLSKEDLQEITSKFKTTGEE